MVIFNSENGMGGFGQPVFKNIATQQADISLIENCARQCDLELKGFQTSDVLELYFDIFREDKSVCYIYKGWKDPGFRLGNLVDLKTRHSRLQKVLGGISKICSKYMLTQTHTEKFDDGFTRVMFEIGIYDGGLNESVFKESIKNFEAAVAEIQFLVAAD